MIVCGNCGEFTVSNPTEICNNCKRKRNTKRYRIASLGILIIGFVIGIITNNVLGYQLMLAIWGSTLITSGLFCGISSITHRLDIIIEQNIKKDDN